MTIDELVRAIHENTAVHNTLCNALRVHLFFARWDELTHLLGFGEVSETFFMTQLNAYNDGLALMSFSELVKEFEDIGIGRL